MSEAFTTGEALAWGADEGLRPRVLDTVHGQFETASWDGMNHSRIAAVNDKVVVLVDQYVKQTTGGIIIPDTLHEGKTLAATTGVLVNVGPQAFVWDSHRVVRWEGAKPSPGDRVYFTKYAGQEYTGADGLVYRLMEDRCIGGVEIASETEEPGAEAATEAEGNVGNGSS